MPSTYLAGNVERIRRLILSARALNIPVLYTEQYPQGLGSTLPVLRDLLHDSPRFEKREFSCLSCEPFLQTVKGLGKTQVVLAGIETHVCVLQSAVHFKERGYFPYVVRDACLSRYKEDYQGGLEFLAIEGIPTPTTEIVIFSWLSTSAHPKFKEISQLLKDRPS
jgi:nicotinamidase-related amidase